MSSPKFASRASRSISLPLRVSRLRARATLWDVHGGAEYLSSSALGLNEPPASFDAASGCSTDTSHDLHDVEHFKDFMRSRVVQARALADDLCVYRGVLDEAGLDSAARAEYAANYAERAVAALYGVDEAAHRDDFNARYKTSRESPYPVSVRTKALRDEVAAGEVAGLVERLDRFADSRERILDRERRHVTVGRFETRAQVVFRSGTGCDEIRDVRTAAFLRLYVAEICGRDGFWNRCLPPGAAVSDRGVRLRGTTAELADARKIIGLCGTDLRSGGRVLAHAFDAQGLVDAACRDADAYRARVAARYGAIASAVAAMSCDIEDESRTPSL